MPTSFRTRLRRLMPAFLLAFALPAAALAQGTDRMFAPPISTPELAEYFTRLGASPDQQQAIMRMHARYQAEFRALREGDLQQVIDRMAILQQSFMPAAAEVSAIGRAIESGEQQIVRTDNRFFDELQSVLTPAQMGRMQRLRLSRDRSRIVSGSAGMMMMTGLEGLELELTLRRFDIDPTAEGQEAVDAVLDTYERRLTNELNRLSRVAGDFFSLIAETIEAANIPADTNIMEDPEAMERLMEASQAVMGARMVQQQEIVRDIRNLALNAGRQISSMLDPDLGAGFRRAVLGAVYPELSWGFIAYRGSTDFLWHVARMIEEEEGDWGNRIRGALSEITPRVDRQIDRAAAVVQERDTEVNIFEFDVEVYQRYADRISSKQEEVQALYQSLATLLDEFDRETQATRSWQLRLTAGDQPSPDGVEVDVLAEAEDVEGSRVAMGWGGDWSIPVRMGRSDVRRMTRLLDLNDGERSIVDQLYNQYTEDWNAIEQIGRVRQLVQRMWRDDPESGEGRLDEEGLRNLRSARRLMMEQVLATDESFFEAIETTTGNDERSALLEAARASRKFVVLARAPHMWLAGNQQEDQEWRVNMLQLVLRAPGQPGSEAREAAKIIAERGDELTTLSRRLFEAGLDATYEQERWQIRQMAGEFDASGFNEFRRAISAMTATMSDTRREMAEINRALLGNVTAVLSRERSDRLRSEFDRQAFPTIYAGTLEIEPFLHAALELADLSTAQREQVLEMLGAYRPEFDRYSETMVTLIRRMAEETNRLRTVDNDDMAEYRVQAEINRELERLRHDRNELTYRSLLTLRSILTPDQITAVGPLPDLTSLIDR